MNQNRNKTKKDLQNQLSNIKKTINRHYANSVCQSNIKTSNTLLQPVRTQNLGYNDYAVVVKRDKQKQQIFQLQMKRITEHIQNQNNLNEMLQKKTICLENQLEKSQIKLTGEKDLLENKLYYTQKQLEKLQSMLNQLNFQVKQTKQKLSQIQIKLDQTKKDLEDSKRHNKELQKQITILKNQKKQLLEKVSQQIQQRLKAEQNQKIAKNDIKISINYAESLQTAMIKRQPMNSKQQRQFRVLRNLYIQKQQSQRQKHDSQRKPYFKMIQDLCQLRNKLKLPEQPSQDWKHAQLRNTIQNLKKQLICVKNQNSIMSHRIQNHLKIKQINIAQQNLIQRLQGQNGKYIQQIKQLRLKVIQSQKDYKYVKSSGNYFTDQSNSRKEDFKQYFKIKFDIYQKRISRNNGNSNVGKIYSP